MSQEKQRSSDDLHLLNQIMLGGSIALPAIKTINEIGVNPNHNVMETSLVKHPMETISPAFGISALLGISIMNVRKLLSSSKK